MQYTLHTTQKYLNINHQMSLLISCLTDLCYNTDHAGKYNKRCRFLQVM